MHLPANTHLLARQRYFQHSPPRRGRQRFTSRSQHQPRSILPYLHQVRHGALGVGLSRLAQQPGQSLQDHVVLVFLQQLIRKAHDLSKELMRSRSPDQRHTSRTPPPAIRRFRPPKNFAATVRIGSHHRRQQIMHQRVVIRPTAHTVEPGSEELEFIVAEILRLFFEQENSEYLLFQIPAREKPVGDLRPRNPFLVRRRCGAGTAPPLFSARRCTNRAI